MRRSHLSIVTALAAIWITVSNASFAGSICGTVRDALTSQPVPQAALFLFDNLDQYTGLYAGTDVNGEYCIHDVPAGTYTLQVKVNDYLVATVPGVKVAESPTGVDVDVAPRFGLAQPWPNPASTTVTFGLSSPPGTPVELDVFDVAGRRVHGWKGHASAAGERTIEWNLRDFNGTELQSGIYFVRLRAAGQTAVRRFVRLR